MAPERLHESPEELSQRTLEMGRALRSLMEELEAVDWYAQRIDATADIELRRVLAHNMDEEKEHACMMLEWIRRHDEAFDRHLRAQLFRSGSIVSAESEHAPPSPPPRADPSLRLGGLRSGEEWT